MVLNLRPWLEPCAKEMEMPDDLLDFWLQWCDQLSLDEAFARYILDEFPEKDQDRIIEIFERHFPTCSGRIEHYRKPKEARATCKDCGRPISVKDTMRFFKPFGDELEIDPQIMEKWLIDATKTGDAFRSFRANVLKTIPVEEHDHFIEELHKFIRGRWGHREEGR